MSEMEKMPQEEMEIDTPGTEETVEAAAEEKADKKKKDKKYNPCKLAFLQGLLYNNIYVNQK